jgi:hypothetical protein
LDLGSWCELRTKAKAQGTRAVVVLLGGLCTSTNHDISWLVVLPDSDPDPDPGS